ncbi:hypothetical protein [Halosimplex sp. TS25]|uniref:hypothetical protein n=1 Tax=Halosimplex rarum TaxID=3396619 RepID=UPI0039E918A5
MRSTAAKAVVAVAFLAIGGVAAAQIGVFNGVAQEDHESLEHVPDGVDSVATLDVSVVEEDVSTTLYAAAYNATVGASESDEESPVTATPGDEEDDDSDAFEDGAMTETSPAEMVPANLSAALDETENQTGLDPRAADEVVMFNQQRNYSQPQYSGAVVYADWSEDDVIAAVSNSSDKEYENTTVDGVTVYQPVENESDEEDELSFGPPEPEEWIAVLDEGEYVFGTQDAVNDTIDVAAGDAESVDGDLASAYEETRDDGYLRYAQRSQNVNITEINRTMGQQTGLNVTAYAQAYNDLHVTSGSYYIAEDDTLGFESRILTNSTDTAQDVQDITQGFISIQAGAIQNETLEDQLRSTNVTRDGTTVTVTRETSVDTAVTLIKWYGSILTDTGSTTGAATGSASASATAEGTA